MAGHKIGGNPMTPRRHITVDNISKVIYIQVKYTFKGDIEHQEYYDIANGLWYKYVPDDYVQQFREAINGGYQVRPIIITGMMNNDYYIQQIVDVKESKLVTLT